MEPCYIQNHGLFRAQGIFKGLSNMSDDQAYSEPWYSQNSLFQGYLDIFKDVDACSTILTSTQLRGRGEASPAVFENQKKCSDFGKKDPNCFHLWIKFSTQNIVLKVRRRENSKMCP